MPSTPHWGTSLPHQHGWFRASHPLAHGQLGDQDPWRGWWNENGGQTWESSLGNPSNKWHIFDLENERIHCISLHSTRLSGVAPQEFEKNLAREGFNSCLVEKWAQWAFFYGNWITSAKRWFHPCSLAGDSLAHPIHSSLLLLKPHECVRSIEKSTCIYLTPLLDINTLGWRNHRFGWWHP